MVSRLGELLEQLARLLSGDPKLVSLYFALADTALRNSGDFEYRNEDIARMVPARAVIALRLVTAFGEK